MIFSKNFITVFFLVFFVSSELALGIESPEYRVVKVLGNNIEIRQYSPSKWVATNVNIPAGDYQRNSQGSSFRKLFNYISGSNDIKQKIDMTAPVTMVFNSQPKTRISGKTQCNIEMAFYIPKNNQNNIPNPTDKDVYIKNEPEATFAVARFGGFANLDINLRNRDRIIEALGNETANYDTTNFIAAGYNSPFEFLFRRNEVWLRKIN